MVLFDFKATSACRVVQTITGSTDNLGNTLALQKYMSTKWPLAPMIMELSEQCRSRNLELHLSWQRRNFNTEADSLTNGDFSAFQIQNQVHFDFPNIPWLVLTEALVWSKEVYDLTKNLKATRNAEGFVPQHTWKRRKLAAGKRLKATDPW